MKHFVELIIISSFVTIASNALKPPKEWNSFSLKTSIYSVEDTSKDKHELNLLVKLQERYSSEQKRAKISYDIQSNKSNLLPKKGIFYLDKSNNVALLVDEDVGRVGKDKCKSSSVDSVKKQLYLVIPALEESNVADDFIIGPTRLLFLIDSKVKKSQFNQLTLNDNKTTMHNIDCFKIDFEYNDYKFTVYYSALTALTDDYPSPLVVMITNKLGKTLSYEFSQIELLDYNSPQQELERGSATIDPMTFSLASGCYKALAQLNINQKDLLFYDKSIETTKFSFKTETESKFSPQEDSLKQSNKIEKFIAYDAKLDSLRIDTLTNLNFLGKRRLLYNFKTDQFYDIIEDYRTNLKSDQSKQNFILDLKTEESSLINGYNNNNNNLFRSNCFTSQVFDYYHSDRVYDFRELLMGGKKFVYMGKARVRGIDALVYESDETKLPFWWKQPLAFDLGLNQSSGHYYNKPKSSQALKNLNTILYFGGKESNNPLLLIEFITSEYDDNQNLIKQEKDAISIYDFSWDLTEAPNGDKINELFSLEDLCSNNLGQNKYSKIEISLEIDAQSKLDFNQDNKAIMSLFNNPVSRNFAILSAIQNNIKVSSNMVFDLQSRIKYQQVINNELKQVITVSFRIAENLNNLTEAIYNGQGRINPHYRDLKVIKNCDSLAICYSLAGHGGGLISFGYDLYEKTCYLEGIKHRIFHSEMSFSIPDEQGPIEIYKLNRKQDHQMRNREVDSKSIENRFLGYKIELLYENSMYNEDGSISVSQPPRNINYIIKRIIIDDNNQVSPIIANIDNNRDQQVIMDDKIIGLGLINLDNQDSKLVLPAMIKNTGPNVVDEEEESTMTYDQCHAVCMSDMNCKSFSTCIKDSKTQCVISRYNLKTLSVYNQLKSIDSRSSPLNNTQNNQKSSAGSNSMMKENPEKSQKKNLKLGSKISIELDRADNDTNAKVIELIKHPSCLLYNKNYMELFDKHGSENVGYNARLIEPVVSREECAVKCIERSLSAVRSYADEELNTAKLLKEEIDLDTLRTLHDKHKQASQGWCSGIYYMDRKIINNFDIEKDLQTRIKKDDLKTKLSTALGYCIINSNLRKERSVLLSEGITFAEFKDEKKLSFEHYIFKVEFFYEKKYGARLKPSPMTPIQEKAYEFVSSPFKSDNENVNQETYSILKRFVEKGDNAQYEMYIPTTDCANYCFSHSWHMWPACRSFDMIYEMKNNHFAYTCVMNTITLQQAIANNRTDLIEYGSDFYHYDPRPGFMLEASILSGNNLLIESQSLFRKIVSNNGFRIYTFGSFVLIILGIIFGIYLGVLLAKRSAQFIRYSARSQSISGQVLPMDP